MGWDDEEENSSHEIADWIGHIYLEMFL